jgi:hypothetical protein
VRFQVKSIISRRGVDWDMPSPILERIAGQVGFPALFEALAEGLTPSDLQSLLLEVYRTRASVTGPSEVMARSGKPLHLASSVDARLLNRFDWMAFEAAKGFEAMDLAPVCAFGTEAVLGRVDQNNLLTTIRNAEVLGDATPALALECARRRKKERAPSAIVRLCNSHRVVRMQPFDFPGFTPHFRLFSLVSAGRDMGSSAFEMWHLGEHIRFYLRLFRALNGEGFRIAAPLVEVSDLRITEDLLAEAGVTRGEIRESIRAHHVGGSARFLEQRGVALPREIEHRRLAQIRTEVFEPVHAEFPEAELRFNLARLEGLGYYPGLCLRISPMAADGVRYPVIDGGFTDWTARLLEDRKERLLTSCIGTEFTCRRFRLA